MAAGMCPEDKRAILLALDKDKITVSLLTKMFAHRTKKGGNAFDVKPPEFDTSWKLVLAPGEYINKEQVQTTVGIFLFNKLLIEGDISSIIPNGYYNEIITKKKMNKLLDLIADAVKNRILPVKPSLYEFLRAYEFWGLKLVTIFSASYSMAMMNPSKEFRDKKEAVLATIKGDSVADMVAARTKLLDEARKEVQADPGMSLFTSGSRGSFDNDFGNMFVAIGPVDNPGTGGVDFIKSNYINGISKEDLVAAGNIVINSEYPKAIGTARGGYMTKQFNAVFQSIAVGPKDSDCGTKGALEVTLTPEILHLYVDQYIDLGNGKLLLITPNLDSKYLNHPIKIRSPMYCLRLDDNTVCNHCAGERFYKVDIKNMGLTATDLSGQMLNANMKLRHSLLMEMDKIDPAKIIHTKRK